MHKKAEAIAKHRITPYIGILVFCLGSGFVFKLASAPQDVARIEVKVNKHIEKAEAELNDHTEHCNVAHRDFIDRLGMQTREISSLSREVGIVGANVESLERESYRVQEKLDILITEAMKAP